MSVINFPTSDPTPHEPADTIRLFKSKRTEVIGVRVPVQLRLWFEKEADRTGFTMSTIAAVYLFDAAKREIVNRKEREAA